MALKAEDRLAACCVLSHSEVTGLRGLSRTRPLAAPAFWGRLARNDEWSIQRLILWE
jgi:hypothetical protein